LETGGHLQVEKERTAGLTQQQRDMREAVVVMISGVLLTALTFVVTSMKGDLFLLVPISTLLFFGGFIRLIYVWLVESEEIPHEAKAIVERMHGMPPRARVRGVRARQAELPPQREFTAPELASSRPETAEMATPPSVTEQSTRLLDGDEKE
jgi:hypothetical protein